MSLREVARRAGVSHAAVYRHFPHRAGLIATVGTEGMWRLAATLERVERDAAARSPTERIAELGVAYVGFARRHRAHFRAMFAREVARKAQLPELRSASDAAAAPLLRAVEAARAAGELPSTRGREIALAVWSLAHGIAMLDIDEQFAEGELSLRGGTARTLSLVRSALTRLLEGYRRR